MLFSLPISKSIAQRVLVVGAMRGVLLSPLESTLESACLPGDVRLMYESLRAIQSSCGRLRLDLENNGTAMRFLTAYCAQLPGAEVVLDGVERMRERPIGQLVDALREIGADIEYLGTAGFPPLLIKGGQLRKDKRVKIECPLSSQFVSALLLIGVEVDTSDTSPYIEITREVVLQGVEGASLLSGVESDLSAAAFWLERRALGLPLPDAINSQLSALSRQPSLQGDKVAFNLFREIENRSGGSSVWRYDFSSCPDLYPAVAVTCHRLGISTCFTGLERLRYKESDRLAAIDANLRRVASGEVAHSYGDHRIAMAFLAAGYEVDDVSCISKSYPAFLSQLYDIVRVIPCREEGEKSAIEATVEGGLVTLRQGDEGKGKKHALSLIMRKLESRYVWLSDDDVLLPPFSPQLSALSSQLTILPLRMTDGGGSMLERLQVLEYDAIQGLTLFAAQRGHAVMCSAANMIVETESWLRCESELRPELTSGDDMFLLEAMKRRGMKVSSLFSPLAYVSPQPTLRLLFGQRMRWAGKAPHYTDSDIRWCGALVVLSNVLAVVCPPWLIMKWVADTVLIARYRRAVGATKITAGHLCSTLLLTIVYPWYMFICLIGGFFRKGW